MHAKRNVNDVGEHTDYNEGYVLPLALPMVTVMVGSKVALADEVDQILSTIYSCTVHNESPQDSFIINSELGKGSVKWANYVKVNILFVSN